jgi:hypothetical protein
MEDNRSYFLRRAEQERSAATLAEGKARAAHLELADRYLARAEAEAIAEEPTAA